MSKKVDRIIFDTNVWISFLITKNFKTLDAKIKSGFIKLIFSHELFEEFLVVVNRPKFKPYFSKVDLEALIDLFDVYGETHTVVSEVNICRDKKDNFLLSLAKDAQADYLLTGDEDLLILKEIESTKIMTIAEYITHKK